MASHVICLGFQDSFIWALFTVTLMRDRSVFRVLFYLSYIMAGEKIGIMSPIAHKRVPQKLLSQSLVKPRTRGLLSVRFSVFSPAVCCPRTIPHPQDLCADNGWEIESKCFIWSKVGYPSACKKTLWHIYIYLLLLKCRAHFNDSGVTECDFCIFERERDRLSASFVSCKFNKDQPLR